jgi:tetratricopeptide (TPR) repeat protein
MNKKLVTEIINNQGVILAKLGRYKEAIKLFEGLITLGITDNLDDALIYFNKSLDLAKQANENIAHVLVEIADIYFNKEDLKKTLEYYNEAFEAGKKENADAKLMTEVIHNIGIISAKLGRYEDAIELFSTYINSNDPTTKCLSQIGLGLVYFMINEIDESEKYLKIGLNYAKKIGNKQLEAITYMYLGRFFRRSNYLNIAKQLFREVYGFHKYTIYKQIDN